MIRPGFALLMLATIALAACSSSKASPPAGTGGTTGSGGIVRTGGTSGTGGVSSTGGASGSGGVSSNGGVTSTGGSMKTGGMTGSGGMPDSGGVSGSGDATSSGGIMGTGSSTKTGGSSGTGGMTGKGGSTGSAAFPFPQNFKGKYCTLPSSYDNEKVRAAYKAWKDATITSEGAGGFLRVKKPDSGTVIGSTVSEGIGYGMILAVYMDDQVLFDGLWKYEQIHLDGNGLMNWEIGPDGNTTSGGTGAATDGDEDMAWALVMADRQWGGKGTLSDTYLANAKKLIDLIWKYEVDHTRKEMLKPGDQWGDVDVTNPSYFAPAYFHVFGQVTGKVDDWNKVIVANYDILERSLNATSGNATNGLVPAWCDSSGALTTAYSGSPKHFQNDSTRTPFRVGQDYCYFGEPRAKSYLEKITSFYVGIGVSKIVDGYDLNGTPRPEKAVNGAQAASFVGPAGVGAMSDAKYQSFLDAAYTAVATLNLNAGTIYYQKSWTALSLLMMTGSLPDFTQLP
jgi:endo-1,4-beta-D-glucanase Y